MNNPGNNIRFLSRNEIDIRRWDQCIEHSANSLIYARSFYLDTMSKNWSALILNDYEAVLPLTWNRKYFISYLYQPSFTQQGGIFFSEELQDLIPGKSEHLTQHFLEKIPARFRFSEISLNAANLSPTGRLKANFILDLSKSYDFISNAYQKRVHQYLKKLSTSQFIYKSAEDFSSVIQLYRTRYGKRFPHVRTEDYRKFQRLCGVLQNKQMLLVREVKDHQGRLLTTSIFFKDDRRIYNVMPFTTQSGRDQRAHFFLLDQLIREFSASGLLLDFEGSEVAGIAEFYKKFGAENQPYPVHHYNHLPFPLSLFK